VEPNNRDNAAAEAQAKPAVGSRLELSPQANSLKAAEQLTQSLPDVDLAKVASIKKALDSGDFRIDSQQIADKMLAFDALLAR
jgi:negative regulator of flagellin synthesis FlgM